jgi:hypothetical protein
VGRDTDDDVWRAIVENYGDRVELDDDPGIDARIDDLGHDRDHELDQDEPEVRHDRRRTDKPEHGNPPPVLPEDDDRFVPPPPPPLPVVAPDRMLAWVGLFGSPAILLLALVFGIALPPWLGYLLVAGFLGGFGYLVVKMPRGPADPWDDGARL